ncbi:MAG: DUF2460 domain-containing protein, partial [Pseudomonadota bacterium]|nr:DUF2460 domain-containing protein [Pseudomonadota bacterium]
MSFWFTRSDAPVDKCFIKRFTPRHWTVDFPRGAMASVTMGEDAHALVVDVELLRQGDLAGLIWDSVDRGAHPAQAREAARDYSGCILSFRWQSQGFAALDTVNGPVLTIEASDGRAWYVRLWNYAAGSASDAHVTLDLDALDGGYLLPAEADRVDPTAIERMFISIVPQDYVEGSAVIRAAREPGRVTVSDIRCHGRGSVISGGDAVAPENGLGIATAYDDLYHRCPERLVEEIEQSGYRGTINHYVGMSHYPALGSDGRVDWARGMCAPARAWHAALARAAKAHGYRLIWSLSYEILDMFCPEEWKQRFADGTAAATGYEPPSTLVSPASEAGIAYLGRIAAELVELSVAAGLEPLFQIGEPWWWIGPDARPALYDSAAVAAFGGSPPLIADVGGTLDAGDKALLDAAGELLASSTAAVTAAAVAAAPATVTHVLVFVPGLLDPARPEVRRANLPLGWARPAFDVLQVEDYDWLTSGQDAKRVVARAELEARLGYARGEQHYLAGFATQPHDAVEWGRILAAADEARRLGVAEILLWAWPQVARDGLTIFGERQAMDEFADVSFPIAIGQEASVVPGFSTNVVTSASGHEYRNANWSQARLRFDAGPGVRSEAEMAQLISFFRARRGPAVGFRFRDPFDHSSGAFGAALAPSDQHLGDGDATTTRFALRKIYGGEEQRRITRPVAGCVRVAVGGAERLSGWTIEA